MVSRDSVRIALTISALNDLKVLLCDIKNSYLTAKRREKILNVAGTELGPEQGKIVLVLSSLYGMKSYGAAFRGLISEQLHNLLYSPSISDPDVLMRPAVKPGWFMYYVYVLFS